MPEELSDKRVKNVLRLFYDLQDQIHVLNSRVDGHDELFGPADQIAGELERLSNETSCQSSQLDRLEKRITKIEQSIITNL